MFGPKRTALLDSFDYRLIISALDREALRLQAESEKHRDAYDPPAWAETTTKRRLLGFLRNRLEHELSELPVLTAEEKRWEESHLRRSAGSIPRSKANAAVHHANVVKRREAAEARRAATGERKNSRSGPGA